MAVSFIVGGNQSTQRKPLPCRKSPLYKDYYANQFLFTWLSDIYTSKSVSFKTVPPLITV